MKIFITGATGGIGHHVSQALITEGFQVAALVRPESKDKLNPKVQPIFGNLTELDKIQEDFLKFNPNGLIHLGWIGVDKTSKGDLNQIENLKVAVRLFELARQAQVQTFIGMGSEAEYGVQNTKLAETALTLPLTNYALAKLATGLICQKNCQDLGINFVWLRLFSSYGPGDRPGSLMSLLIKNLLAGEDMPLSPCEQVWDYLHVKDIARLIPIVLKDPKEGGVFNLGGGKAQPIKNVVLKIAELIETKSELQFGKIPYGPRQMMHLEADISKLKKVYGWAPEISLEDGLLETVNSHKTKRSE